MSSSLQVFPLDGPQLQQKAPRGHVWCWEPGDMTRYQWAHLPETGLAIDALTGSRSLDAILWKELRVGPDLPQAKLLPYTGSGYSDGDGAYILSLHFQCLPSGRRGGATNEHDSGIVAAVAFWHWYLALKESSSTYERCILSAYVATARATRGPGLRFGTDGMTLRAVVPDGGGPNDVKLSVSY